MRVPVSVAELRRRLPAGTVFRAEYVAAPILPTTVIHPERSVVSQTTHQMVTVVLDGPKKGQKIRCTWKGVKAYEENGAITLSQDGAEFVRFTFGAEPGGASE